jgi:hypothetical protein
MQIEARQERAESRSDFGSQIEARVEFFTALLSMRLSRLRFSHTYDFGPFLIRVLTPNPSFPTAAFGDEIKSTTAFGDDTDFISNRHVFKFLRF